jgi:hypothetical protein
MQQRIAKHMLKSLRTRGWTDGAVVTLRRGVYGIEITTPLGERCQFATVDDIRLTFRLVADQLDRGGKPPEAPSIP